MAKESGEVVNLRKKVQVKGIKHKDDKKQKLEVGKVYNVTEEAATNLVETGHAVMADGAAKKK